MLILSVSAAATNFPRPASLEPAVQFWTRVYTEITTDQGYIHDAENLSVVYRTLDLPPLASRSHRGRMVDGAKAEIAGALTALAGGKRSSLSPIEQKVLAAWPAGTDNSRLRQAANSVRFQLGQADRFRDGLIRSGQWKPHIQHTLAAAGLPPELDVLPHVESSFNPEAYSRVAAAGMWQFMPATARQFMRVDHVVDQRLDPFVATEGAIKLLASNYRVTGTWPLALTSYNHGTGGVLRAARSVGTTDIDVIIERYRGRAFGFASRNFYPSFLAALDVDRNARKHWGDVPLDTPIDYDVLPLPAYTSADALIEALGVGVEDLQRHNPALREPVWLGEKHVPRGYTLRLPRSQLNKPLAQYLEEVPENQLFDHQQPDLTHTIRPGESLWVIARRYQTSVAKLKDLNGLRGNNIRAGKTLILPGKVIPEPPLAGQSRVARAKPAPGTYVIRPGDSLWSIARRFQVSQQELLAWNDLSPKRYLQPGQELRITAAAGTQR